MRVVFVIGAIWLFYIYAGYPLLLLIVASWSRIRVRFSDKYSPLVSVLIAARNEERDIGWKITETLALNYPKDKLEVLVASDASDDRTDEIVSAIRDSRLTFARMDHRGGKVRALNRLAQIARGEILFFTDANAHVEPQSLRRMVSHFADPRVGCVTGDSRPIKEMDNPAISSGATAYWGFESFLKMLEGRIGSVLVCDGAIFCARSVLYKPLHPELANDLELPMRIGAAGFCITHEPHALVFERDTNSPIEEFARRRRMCSQGMAAMLELPGLLRGLRGWQFVSHKFLRWTSLIPMVMVLLGSVGQASGSAFFSALAALQAIFYSFAAIGFLKAIAGRAAGHLTAVPFYIVLGVLGALVGVVEATLGKRFDVWEIPALSRGEIQAAASPAAGAAISPEGD